MKPLRGLFIFGPHRREEVGGGGLLRKIDLQGGGTRGMQLIENTNRETIVLNSLCVGGPK